MTDTEGFQNRENRENNEGGRGKSSGRTTIWIFFIIFIILFIILSFLLLYFLFWTDPQADLTRACTASSQCLPNEYCNSKGVCNAITCTIDSDCKAAGSNTSVCLQGYCQTVTCVTTQECEKIKSNSVCTNFTSEIVTPWINTACVETGKACAKDTDCYGGGFGLVCSNNVCVQCREDSDCGNGLICSNNKCTNCSQSLNNCAAGLACLGDGLCCANDLTYNVNGVKSCTKGKPYDICVNDSDCANEKCYDTGTLKVCGFTTNDECLFSAGTKGFSNKGLICPAPINPYDTEAAPFCSVGKCSKYSNGAACSIPPYCSNAFNTPNLLCNGTLTFNNPYQISCKANGDCPEGNTCYKGTCSPLCNKSDSSDCPVGYKCDVGAGACYYPSTAVSCSTSSTVCPKGYQCQTNTSDKKAGTCQYSTFNTQNGNSFPPPFFPSVCSSSSYVIDGNDSLSSGYCVSGACQSYSGWIGQLCDKDDDCALVDSNKVAGRVSLLCKQISTLNGKVVKSCLK